VTVERYDADTAPDPEAWRRLAQDQRMALVVAHHQDRAVEPLHAQTSNARMHAMLHAMVETQAASADPPVTGRTLQRLVADGLRRHAAVHMVADVLLRWMASGQPFDADRYGAELDRLDAGAWLGDQMRRELGAPPK
jgi:hypothetical protein